MSIKTYETPFKMNSVY